MPKNGNLYSLRLIGSWEAVCAGLFRPAVLRRAWSCLLVNASEFLARDEEAVLFRARAVLKDGCRQLRVETFLNPDHTVRSASNATRLATSVQCLGVRSEADRRTLSGGDGKPPLRSVGSFQKRVDP